MKKRIGKGGFELDVLGWMIIGVAILAVMVIAYMIFEGKGWSAIKFIEAIFRTRG